jgi:hypothetical protein
MFYECENHLWRLGPRELPGGVRFDGGSDWVGLHRKFCQYVVTYLGSLQEENAIICQGMILLHVCNVDKKKNGQII